MKSFAKDHNESALALYGQLQQRPGNLFFSPFSIRTALAMTSIGARGKTATQIREALRFASLDETLHIAFAEMIERLKAAGNTKQEMAVANSLWCQAEMVLLAKFCEVIDRYYQSGVNLVDFRSEGELARREINRWVEDNTKQKIRELIPSGGITVDTRLVLVNAIYFKGLWVIPFNEEDTYDETFYLEGGGQVQVPMMSQEEEVRHFHADGIQAVDVDYLGSDLSMLVLLPDNRDGLPDLEARLSADMLYHCVEKMRVPKVKVFLPRFKLTWGTIDLSSQLRALGMSKAFSRVEADFSGINGHQPPDEESLWIAAVYHKAFVEVNEKGTEAAAATGVTLQHFLSRGPSIPVFRADHPFLFAIRERKTGAILFLGRVADPTQES